MNLEEMHRLIMDKKGLYLEISLRVKRNFRTVETHWFNPVNIPDGKTAEGESFSEVVEEVLKRTIESQISTQKQVIQ